MVGAYSMRVAIYARVSTDDKGQDPDNQLHELRALCSNSGYTIVQEYIDRQSGRRGADKRQQFAALLDAAARRKFDCVLFWALDRFSREGMAQLICSVLLLMALRSTVTLSRTYPRTMSWCETFS
jgi:DNA invertase Pin-like site-specific DNA recombinase